MSIHDSHDDAQPSYDIRIGSESDPYIVKSLRTHIMHMPQSRRNVLAASLTRLLNIGYTDNEYCPESMVVLSLMILKPH